MRDEIANGSRSDVAVISAENILDSISLCTCDSYLFGSRVQTNTVYELMKIILKYQRALT